MMRLSRKQKDRAVQIYIELRATAPSHVTYNEARLLAADYGVTVPEFSNARRPLRDMVTLARVAARIAQVESSAWWTIKNRQTGTTIYLEKGENELPYMIVCGDHGFVLDCDTKKQARMWASVPADWCEECRASLEQVTA